MPIQRNLIAPSNRKSAIRNTETLRFSLRAGGRFPVSVVRGHEFGIRAPHCVSYLRTPSFNVSARGSPVHSVNRSCTPGFPVAPRLPCPRAQQAPMLHAPRLKPDLRPCTVRIRSRTFVPSYLRTVLFSVSALSSRLSALRRLPDWISYLRTLVPSYALENLDIPHSAMKGFQVNAGNGVPHYITITLS
jgi:hypothetical protein